MGSEMCIRDRHCEHCARRAEPQAAAQTVGTERIRNGRVKQSHRAMFVRWAPGKTAGGFSARTFTYSTRPSGAWHSATIWRKIEEGSSIPCRRQHVSSCDPYSSPLRSVSAVSAACRSSSREPAAAAPIAAVVVVPTPPRPAGEASVGLRCGVPAAGRCENWETWCCIRSGLMPAPEPAPPPAPVCIACCMSSGDGRPCVA